MTGEQTLLAVGGLSVVEEVDPLEVDGDEIMDTVGEGDWAQLMVMALATAWPNSCRWTALINRLVQSGRRRKLSVGINVEEEAVEEVWLSCVVVVEAVVGGYGGASFLVECFS